MTRAASFVMLIAQGLISLHAAENAQSFEVLFTRAQDDRLAGRSDQALKELLKLQADLRSHPELSALALNVRKETAETYLSRSSPSKDDLTQAAACFEAVIAEQPKDGFVHYRLGLIYRQLGDNRRASQNLQEAIQDGSRNLAAEVNLIEAAFASGQSALGLRTAKNVISSNLRSPDLLLRLGRLLLIACFIKKH